MRCGLPGNSIASPIARQDSAASKKSANWRRILNPRALSFARAPADESGAKAEVCARMRGADARPRVAFLTDRPGGPCDLRARELAARLGARFAFQLASSAAALDAASLDLLYVFFRGDRDYARLGLPPQRVVLELAELPADDGAFLREDAATWTAPSRALFAALRELHPRVLHLPWGVDLARFRTARRARSAALRIGWIGDARDPEDGARELVTPACSGRFALDLCDARRSPRARAAMLQRADVIAVATPDPRRTRALLEGMACGAFPVTCDGAPARDWIVPGVNGLVVPRSADAFREAFAWCEANLGAVRRAGRLDAELVREEHDADALAERFGDALESALGRAPAPPAALPQRGAARTALARGVVPLRIAFVTPEFADDEASGGLDTYLRRMAGALVEAGHRPEIFAIGRQPALPQRRSSEIRVHRVEPALQRRAVRQLDRALHHLRLHALRPALECAADAFALAWRLRRRALRAPFDLVQSSDHRACGLFVPALAPAGAHWMRLSLDDPHAARVNGEARPRAWLDRLYGEALRRAERRYAPSAFLARHLLATRGLHADVVRPPAHLDPKPSEPRQRLPERYFAFVGKLVATKGAPLLAEALKRVLREEPRFAMVWLGPDPMRAFPGWTAGWAPHASRVRYLGELRRDEVYGVLAGADAAVLPSLFDNLPNSAIEALLLGVPVIGSRGASIDELVEDGVTGVLVPMGDADALADAMLAQWRGRTGVAKGFRWEPPEAMRPERAVANLLEATGLTAPARAELA
jgi:glycosyltransferase involved in cell wall biosynthesis